MGQKSQWIEVGPSGGERTAPDRALDCESLSPVVAYHETVVKVLADEALGQLVKEQLTLPDLAQLGWREVRHNETVADVDVELVSGSSSGRMRVKPGP